MEGICKFGALNVKKQMCLKILMSSRTITLNLSEDKPTQKPKSLVLVEKSSLVFTHYIILTGFGWHK